MGTAAIQNRGKQKFPAEYKVKSHSDKLAWLSGEACKALIDAGQLQVSKVEREVRRLEKEDVRISNTVPSSTWRLDWRAGAPFPVPMDLGPNGEYRSTKPMQPCVECERQSPSVCAVEIPSIISATSYICCDCNQSGASVPDRAQHLVGSRVPRKMLDQFRSANLSDREIVCLSLIRHDRFSQRQAADFMGLSKTHVVRLLRAGLEKVAKASLDLPPCPLPPPPKRFSLSPDVINAMIPGPTGRYSLTSRRAASASN
jgi:predicted DNA-binding protein (UPF0251 family)